MSKENAFARSSRAEDEKVSRLIVTSQDSTNKRTSRRAGFGPGWCDVDDPIALRYLVGGLLPLQPSTCRPRSRFQTFPGLAQSASHGAPSGPDAT